VNILYCSLWYSLLLEVEYDPGPSAVEIDTIQFTSLGIKPATFRLVKYCINHTVKSYNLKKMLPVLAAFGVPQVNVQLVETVALYLQCNYDA
jgi:hypothetical protein